MGGDGQDAGDAGPVPTEDAQVELGVGARGEGGGGGGRWGVRSHVRRGI